MKPAFTAYLLVTTLSFTACSAQEEPLIAEGAELNLVASDFSFTEGPAVDAAGNVYFTDQPNDRILKWNAGTGEVSVFMEPAGRANGLYVDDNGHLLACADEKFQLWRISPEKEVTVLVDDYQGRELNGPNDLWVDAEGGVYFTDPYYQRPYWERQQPEIKEQRVYYLAPDGSGLRIVADDLVQPNGIIGSPDGSTLYVADIGDKKTYAYGIKMEGDLFQKTLVAEMGSDGMTLDSQGNLYLTGDGVTVFNKDGEKILHIPVPQKWTANVTFGGPEQKTLFITAMNSVYTLKMNVHGVR
jgi:gluconolactonase